MKTDIIIAIENSIALICFTLLALFLDTGGLYSFLFCLCRIESEEIMSKVEIKQDESGRTKVMIDGIVLKNVVCAKYTQSVGEAPKFIFDISGRPDVVIQNAEVQVCYRAGTIQEAAEIVCSEFLKKADWYDALVASINGVLMEGSSEYLTRDLAVKIADRIIGLR